MNVIDHSTCTERELLARVATGDERAFRRLFDAYQPRVYSFAVYLTRSVPLAEDIVQEVFTRVWVAREEAREVEFFHAYVKTIARNVAANHLKRLARERVILGELLADAPATTSSTEDEVLENEFRRLLDEAVAALPPRQREVFLLHRRDHLKQEEIAERLHLSYHTVKEHMKKALAALRLHVERRIDLVVLLALQRFFW
ncbi:MAG: RNA polymerase sigma-70 factor [Odoribacteraceae bacterium]|jgi:RNA polymerase sigma-70 factor (ECF subfamily)|nr:RNA polymerase sigma-70 factor [Odoribacteraceae bacterium]